MERRFYLVDAQVLPEVFLKVVRAKELLASGEARSISAATRAVDLSRSAFYKIKIVSLIPRTAARWSP